MDESQSARGSEPSPGMCQGLCWAPAQTPAHSGCSRRRTTDNVHGVIMHEWRGSAVGTQGWSVWLAVLAGGWWHALSRRTDRRKPLGLLVSALSIRSSRLPK